MEKIQPPVSYGITLLFSTTQVISWQRGGIFVSFLYLQELLKSRKIRRFLKLFLKPNTIFVKRCWVCFFLFFLSFLTKLISFDAFMVLHDMELSRHVHQQFSGWAKGIILVEGLSMSFYCIMLLPNPHTLGCLDFLFHFEVCFNK